MKKIKVNGVDVPTPIGLKWKAEKYSAEIVEESRSVMIAPSIRSHFLSKDRLEENHIIKKIKYMKVYHNHSILWNKKNSLQLPLRLFNIKKYNEDNEVGTKNTTTNIKELKKYVEKVRRRTDIKNYATLSYVWGKVEDEDELTLLGRKSLTKSIETCNLLGINYLWIDQLCINQKDRDEKADEVKKMRKCYGDSAVTLVSINTELDKEKTAPEEILRIILKSEWFSRSWTFQEGWLSKQTIFMFDDCLVDGRAIARAWVMNQPSYAEVKFNNIEESNEGSRKIATPVGWMYYKGEFSTEDTVILTLSQALREISNRGRGIPVDGVYSILGLLPYGENVKVEYKEKVQGGDHPTYFKKDVEKALLEVMKKAVKAGYGEPLAWFGSSYESPKRCWLPTVIFDEQTKEREKWQKNGSTNVEGGIKILTPLIHKGDKDIDEIFTEDGNIKVNCSEYIIKSVIASSISAVEENFSVRTDASCREIAIENHSKIITVLGTKESLDKLKFGHLLLIPNKEEWKSEKPFAILAERKDYIRHRIGLVQILNGVEGLENERQIEVTIGGYKENNTQLTEQISPNSQAHIEIP